MSKIKKVCKHCGKKYDSWSWRNPPSQFCSKKCSDMGQKRRRRENHLNWKNGKSVTALGYILFNASDGRRMYEHRFIIEQTLGRKLSTKELVHHINEDRSDNRIENLQVMTKAEHQRLHKTKA